MQLKFKKICLFSTIIIYCASFLLQSNFVFFQTWAKEKNTRVNIVAILVDDKIYDKISTQLRWYSNYVQSKLSDTKALVIPLDLTNIHAYDIHRMMENIYFDGLSGVNSSLIGLIMFGDIPLPVVNQNWYIFPTVYPYVDFEDQKYVWDSDSEYFVPNGNSAWQAEIWHWLINYWEDIEAYIGGTGFFAKVGSYVGDPDWFIWDSIWYDDFIAQKKWFLSENFPYYRNRIMFAEDLWYQRYSPLMKKIFRWEQAENALDIVSELEEASGLGFSWKDVLLEMSNQWISDMHSTKMVQQEIDDSFVSDYNDLFSNLSMSTMRENVFAWWRWIKEYENSDGEKSLIADSDGSTSKIQLKDDVLLWNENLQWLIENLNDLMENFVDEKIETNKYDMDIVVPVSYEKITWKRLWMWFSRKCVHFKERYDNYYFWNSARYIDNAKDLSIYRWTYRNLLDLDWVTYASLATGNNSSKSTYDKTNLKLRSIWWSYDIFSNQAEWNRWYMMLSVERDLDIYNEEKVSKDRSTKHRGIFGRVRDRSWPDYCDDSDKKHLCENLFDFAQRWWWWASPINLDTSSLSEWKYELSWYMANNSWRSIFDMWWFQSLLPGEDEWMYGTWWKDWKWSWPQTAWTSFKAYVKYASPTQRQWWERKWWHYDRYENHTPDVHTSFLNVNYRNLNPSVLTWNFSRQSNIFTITQRSSLPGCRWFWSKVLNTKYTYKVISSIVKHVSTTEDEINWIDKNRYGTGGVLEWYYNDLRNSYLTVRQDVLDIERELTWLQAKVKDNNIKINELIASLGMESDNLSWIMAQIANGLTWDEYEDEMNNMNSGESRISSLLSELSWNIVGQSWEKMQLMNVYGYVTSLSVDEIFASMEDIVFQEWLNLNNFYSWEVNSSKVWFSSWWILDLKSLETTIKSGANEIVNLYWQIYRLIIEQQKSWETLKNKLLSNVGESNRDLINWLDEVMENIFVINISEDDPILQEMDAENGDEWNDEDWEDDYSWNEEWAEDDTGVVVLSGSTAYDVIKKVWSGWLFDRFDWEYGVKEMFNWLITVDKVWPAIEKAAQTDVQFIKWLKKNKIDFSSFDQAEWINQYAQWAKWPWYDSDWAKKNHGLLIWVSEHMSGMNILTPDRPIDSPRYVSMQSVAWNEMKFIYPDLFKVEVYTGNWKNSSGYDKHFLLTGGQIKKNIIKYLTWKVYEYNKIIDKECNSALNMDRYYNKLQNLRFEWAIPDKSKHGCNSGGLFTYEEFLDVLWWEKMLDVISETLYYQSLTNRVKLSTGNVAEDIELIKKSFSLNEKRAQVMKDYLTEWNEKVKNPIFEIPTYEIFGYEVAYINSDGEDYIFSADEYLWDGSNDNSSNITSNAHPLTEDSPLDPPPSNDSKCKVPTNGKLPLFSMNWTSPWLEWFKCRWEQTLKEPLKVKVTFDSTLGDMLTADSFKDFIRNSELGQTFNDWWESWGKYKDSWDSLLSPKKSNDADLAITQIQMDAEAHNKKVLWWDDGFFNVLWSISNNVKISNTNLLLSDSLPNSELKIQSSVDVWNITVLFEWTWDGCIKLNSEVLCNGKTYSTTFNPKLNPFIWTVSSSNHVAWKVALIMKFGVWGKNIEKVIKYTISPSVLDHVDIKFEDIRTVAWMITPVSVVWYDKYDNIVDWWLEKYDFTVSQWRFLKDWAYQSGFSTNDFRDLNFYYQAPLDAKDGSIATIQIRSSRGNVLWTWAQTVVQAKPEITMVVWGGRILNKKLVLKWDEKVANETYQLLPSQSSKREQWNIETFYLNWKLLVDRLKPIEIDMKDLNWNIVDLDSQVFVTSQNGLMVIWQVNKDGSWNDVFFETSKHNMKSGHLVLYYYPTTVAWNDAINIDIPWFDTRVVNLKINPLGASELQMGIKDGYAKLKKYTDFEIFASDEWWNPAFWGGYLQTDPNYVVFPDLQPAFVYKDVVIYYVNVSNWYLKTRVYWTWAWLTNVKVWQLKMTPVRVVDHEEERVNWIIDLDFGVVDNLLPNSWLNIMYLNYFGSDRWNQWWYLSTNKKYVESLMKKSKKLITTTTLLASEDKIKKVLWNISPGFKITAFENVVTSMTINDWKIDMLVWSLTNMQDASWPSFNWMTVTTETIGNLLNNSASAKENYIFFIPNESDYSLRNWILYDADGEVAKVNKWEVTFQLTSELFDNWDNVWNLIHKWINYWKVIIHYPWFEPKIRTFSNPWTRYFVDNMFSKWSTDMMSSVWIFDWFSEFELDSSYKSIQNSDEVDEKVWFLWKFKNITLFAEWEIVWEATRKYGSELLINLWDPVLSRKGSNEKVYGTDYDWWVWQEILNDPEKNIFWVYQIDFNKDWLKDWLVVYLDWAFKLAKNYGWSPDLREMQELMRIAVTVKNVYVWDADGNGYEDVLVLTDNNQIRAYLNKWWVFDVDWSVACLNQNVFEWEISSTPSNLEWLNKFYVEDMDLDGKVDIVTYDAKWYIKVFYWWMDKNHNPNYLSTEKYACDTWWYSRQVSTIVTALWLQISWWPVYDNSMMYWVWLNKPKIEIWENDLPEYGINFNPRSLEGLIVPKKKDSDGSIWEVLETVMDAGNFDVAAASKKFISNEAKYVNVTLYEYTLIWSTGKNYLFVPISYLDSSKPEDHCLVRKNYSNHNNSRKILMDGDIVTVTVRIKASQSSSCIWAFGDIIQWPWNVYYDKNGVITWFEILQNWSGAIYKWKDWSFSYLVDNIRLSPNQTMVFKYDLEYHHVPLKEMSVTHKTFWSDDDYPDIKLQCVDGREKDFDWFISKWWRLFSKERIYLQELIDNEYKDEDEMTEDYASDTISHGSDVNEIPWIVWDKIDRIKLLRWNVVNVSDDEEGKTTLKSELLNRIREWWLEALNLNINLSLFDEELWAIENVVDDITKWMCNWFSFWGSNNCKWLPVPFNQAFLAPGKYHLFGCWDLPLGPLEWWLPTFFFPGTLITTFWPIPFPWWLKSPQDGFLWAGGWSYPSFIRIYAAPTLTAQLWVAICMWPYMSEHIFPSPLADIAGNCVVFAIKPQCKKDDTKAKKKDKNNPNQVYDSYVDEVKNSGVCLQSQKWPQVTSNGQSSSPFELYSYSSNVTNSEQNGKTTDSNSWNDFSFWETWRNVVNDITWWKNIDVNWWQKEHLDFSIESLWPINLEMDAYIGEDNYNENGKNSIFIWDVDVLWWDFDVNKIKWWIQQWLRKILIDKWLDPQIRYIVNQLTKMHINIKIPDLSTVIDQEVQTLNNTTKNISTIWKNEDEEQSLKPITKWSDISYDNLNKLNKTIANPFESLASLLNESNILNISVEPITVKIPMIFAEDINAYSIYLQQRLTTNEEIFNRWKLVLNDADLELQLWWWTKLQNQIYANLVTLQKYRNFPFEIYEWIHVIDRYLSEIASLINNTIGYLSYWTSTNSQRFVWYVDAIVLILNVIRTYQLLINFSVERWQNCWTCTKDTYDQYSCKLSLLCDMIQLPIIQIPNFKLPNITIDLTDIDLGLDIILPDFNFQPVKIALPEIPNLPEPPAIWVNIQLNLPDIPLIPEPPELPELPSFIPEIELELPILPPAPELPKLPGEIEGLINVAKLIWKIYCIVKWKFGLVWESSVKAKIEQLTQRTYEVKWIDTIMDFTNFSFAPVRNYGLDYEISSHVDLQFDFSLFYDYLDTLTKSINNLSTSTVNWVNRETSDLVNNNDLVWAMESIDWVGIDVNVEVGMANSASNVDIQWLESDDIEYVDYESAKSRLKDVLAYFRQETKDTTMWDTVKSWINSIENQINKVNNVYSNNEGLEKLKIDVMKYLDEEKGYYDDLAALINEDYDWFLAMVDAQSKDWVSKSESNTWKLLTFNVQLFNVDSSTRDVIDTITKTNPYETILGNKKTIVDWYWNAINSNTADDLWLSQKQYLVLRDNIKWIKDQITTMYSVVKPISSTELIAKNSIVSTNKTLLSASDASRLWSNMEVADVIDPSVFSQWIYAKINTGEDSWKITKVVYSDSFTSDIWDQYYYIDNQETGDIVLWDGWAVYLKCFSGDCSKWGGWWKYYKASTVKEIPFKETRLTFDGDTKLKIADWDQEVKNRKVIWQTYDTLSFSWDVENVDAYLIKLVERIDHSYEKADYTSISTPVHYVLALPDWISNLDELISDWVKLELLRKTSKIQSLLSWGDLLQVVYYDSHKNIANVALYNVERKWYYARIATLSFSDGKYNINSPWSNQIVAWKQILWDEQAPVWDPVLNRPSVNKVVSQWANLEKPISIEYIISKNHCTRLISNKLFP